MAEITKRDEKQEEGATLWLESNRKSTLIIGTGVGKSKVAIDILKRLFEAGDLTKDSKILLISNSTILRDINWKEDFIKWDALWLWDLIISECYQTTFRWTDTKWDFCIADEVDFALTEEYGKTFSNNEFKMILGLTGFIDESKKVMMELIAPVIMTYSTQSAQEEGILNKTQFIFVEYDLSKNPKDFTVEYKDKEGNRRSFTQSENDAYEHAEDTCNMTWGMLSALQSKSQTIPLTTSEAYDLQQLIFKNRRATADRKKLLLNGLEAAKVSRKLIDLILVDPNNKVLVFDAYTSQSEKISEVTYHGKNKKDNLALEDLSAGRIRSLGVCKAVDRGINLEGVNFEVMGTYEGSETSFTQRHGRGCRLKPDQILYLYILLPYYYKKVKSKDLKGAVAHVRRPTQMVKWCESMIASQVLINPITIRYDAERDNFVSY